MLNYNFQTGDIIGFVGKGKYAAGINLCSFGIPGISCTHVAVVGPRDPRFPGRLVYESQALGCRGPCARQNKIVRGFQCHPIDELVKLDYHSIWWYRLRCPLYQHEEDRLQLELNNMLGRPYDFSGAGKSGGTLLCQLFAHLCRQEDTSHVFCSEVVAYMETRVGRFRTKNTGAWNPNCFLRAMYWGGEVERPIKIGPINEE